MGESFNTSEILISFDVDGYEPPTKQKKQFEFHVYFQNLKLFFGFCMFILNLIQIKCPTITLRSYCCIYLPFYRQLNYLICSLVTSHFAENIYFHSKYRLIKNKTTMLNNFFLYFLYFQNIDNICINIFQAYFNITIQLENCWGTKNKKI